MKRKIEKADVIHVAQNLDLPKAVIDIIEGRSSDVFENFDIYLRDPEEFFMMTAEEQSVYSSERVIPLWCDHGFSRVVGYDEKKKKYVHYYVEFPEEDIEKTWNWTQLMAMEFRTLWESEFEESDLDHLARELEFRKIDDLINFLNQDAPPPFEQFLEKHKS